jgi:hypothetical protein
MKVGGGRGGRGDIKTKLLTAQPINTFVLTTLLGRIINTN